MIPIRLHRELEHLKKRILSLGALVEQRVRMAAKAVSDMDSGFSEKIIEGDREIDRMEVAVEEECLKTIALHQPVAVDLRFINAVVKINNDLERIGDEAVNIALRVRDLAGAGLSDAGYDFGRMAATVQQMLKMSLDALVHLDSELASEVCQMDEEADRMDAEAHGWVIERISTSPEEVGNLLHLLLISRHLERIGDHATNIAEEVIYLVEGEIVRHGRIGLVSHYSA